MALIAHIKLGCGDDNWEHHVLDEHLREVATLAAHFSTPFAPPAWAFRTGLWHDLGKYQPEFQQYIRSTSGFDAHIETAPGKVKHAIAGAIHGVDSCGPYGRLLAYLIAGHHAGLPDWHPDDAPGSALSQELRDETATLAKAKCALELARNV